MKFDSLQEWLDWQENLNPREIDLGLERPHEVWKRLPQFKPTTTLITVAGTNGKGSSVAILESILLAAGYRVGCYTSPHLVHYNERIRVNGQPLSDQLICQAFERIEQARGEIKLTYFEYGTLAALCAFVDAAVDVAILEVGLGGRLDAVNILNPHGVLITSIDLDHQQWLGPDRESIGKEKAGVMRPYRPVVFSSEDPTRSVLDSAAELEAPLFVLDRDYKFTRTKENAWDWHGPDKQWKSLPEPALEGTHQLRNASGVIMLLSELDDRLDIDRSALARGLESVQIKGRIQRVSGRVEWLLDVAHNPHAIKVLHHYLQKRSPAGKVRAVFGMLKDKEVAAIVRIMDELVDEWYLASIDGDPRGLSASTLHQVLVDDQIDIDAETYDDVDSAVEAAMDSSNSNDLILVFGSFHTVGEALRWREYNEERFQLEH